MTALRTRLFQGALLTGSVLALAACGAPDTDQSDGVSTNAAGTPSTVAPLEARVTSTFDAAGRAESMVLLANEDSPWTGLLVTSLSGGGFDIYSTDGALLISASGPRLRGLAGVSSFALRGESFPLLFGVDETGALRGFAIIRETREVIELPLESEASLPEAASVCLFDEGIGYLSLAVLGTEPTAQILRVRDLGGNGLTLIDEGTRALPFPARSCAAMNDDLVVAGPTAGLAVVDESGDTLAYSQGLSVSDVVYTELLGRPTALTASAQTGLVSVYDALTLAEIATVEFGEGLSTAAFERPVALTLNDGNFGGMAFSTGLMAVYDASDSQVKLVAREVLTRTLVDDDPLN